MLRVIKFVFLGVSMVSALPAPQASLSSTTLVNSTEATPFEKPLVLSDLDRLVTLNSTSPILIRLYLRDSTTPKLVSFSTDATPTSLADQTFYLKPSARGHVLESSRFKGFHVGFINSSFVLSDKIEPTRLNVTKSETGIQLSNLNKFLSIPDGEDVYRSTLYNEASDFDVTVLSSHQTLSTEDLVPNIAVSLYSTSMKQLVVTQGQAKNPIFWLQSSPDSTFTGTNTSQWNFKTAEISSHYLTLYPTLSLTTNVTGLLIAPQTRTTVSLYSSDLKHELVYSNNSFSSRVSSLVPSDEIFLTRVFYHDPSLTVEFAQDVNQRVYKTLQNVSEEISKSLCLSDPKCAAVQISNKTVSFLELLKGEVIKTQKGAFKIYIRKEYLYI